MTALQDDYTPQTTAGLSLVEHPGDLLGRLGPHYDGIKFLAAIRDGELPPPPIASLLGFEIRDIAWGEVTFALDPSLEHYSVLGMVHGGVTATLLDTVMGCALHTVLPQGTGYSTLDISVRYVRPVTVETHTVLATGTVTHKGRRTATAEALLVAAETGKVLATATSTLLIQS